MPYLAQNDAICSRIGGGHAEGFFEAWANLYHRFALAIDAFERHDQAFLDTLWYPDVQAGISGVHWLEACVESANQGAKWVKF